MITNQSTRGSEAVEMMVYKYLPPDRIDVLKNGQIRFTQVSALNDPFESTPLTTKLRVSLIEGQQKLLSDWGAKLSVNDLLDVKWHINKNAYDAVDNIINGVRNDKGILSMSLERSQLLMWSHYCDSHRGFVVGFNGLHEYFQKGIPEKRGGLREVIYSEERPVLPAFDRFSVDNVAEILLWYKSLHWKYEKELRMLHSIKYADDSTRQDYNGNTVYLFNFPVEAVKEVIFGCQMTASSKKEIIGVVAEKYPDAKIYQASLSQTEFDLLIEDVKK